jgi:hypothetical protein
MSVQHVGWRPIPGMPNHFTTPWGGWVELRPGQEPPEFWHRRQFGLRGHESGTCTEYEHYLMVEYLGGTSSEPLPNPFPGEPKDPQYLTPYEPEPYPPGATPQPYLPIPPAPPAPQVPPPVPTP